MGKGGTFVSDRLLCSPAHQIHHEAQDFAFRTDLQKAHASAGSAALAQSEAQGLTP